MTIHPPIEPRDLAGLLAAVVARRPAYTPDWRPGPTGPGALLQQVLARYLQVLGERLNQAPVKNQLAFLDLLGLDTIAAQGARTVVVFHARPPLPDGRVPAGTQVGAKPAAGGDPIVFETEQSIALAAARLTDVVTVLPEQDAYADHRRLLTGGGPAALYDPIGLVPHELYLAHDVHLALAGHATVEVQFDLAVPGTVPVRLVWEYWDGQDWRKFKPPVDVDTENESFDGTAGLTRSGVVRLVTECAETKPVTVRGVSSYWIRARAGEPMPPSAAGQPAQVARIRLRTTISRNGLMPDNGYADQLKLDLTGSFYPLGIAPMAGATWYLASAEAFSKPGAQVRIAATDVAIPQGETSEGSPTLVAEMWVGDRWQPVGPGSATVLAFVQDGSPEDHQRLVLQVPDRTRPAEVNGEEAYWLRIRLTGGGFVETTMIGDPPVTMRQFVPPMLTDLTIDYAYTLGSRKFPTACMTHNDFQWEDRTEQVHGTGAPFEAFVPVQDRTPTVYFGFDGPLPADRVGLYLDLEPASAGSRYPTVRWEYWNGAAWRSLAVEDETGHLAAPGVVNLLWPGTPALPTGQVLHAEGATVQLMGPALVRPFRAGDRIWIERDGAGELSTVESATALILTLRSGLAGSYTQARVGVAALPRFGVPRSWLRARLDHGSVPPPVVLHGAYANAAWAVQARTISGELLGASTGQAGQTVFFTHRPVLRGEEVEVRELSGPRAAIELPLLVADLQLTGLSEQDLRVVHDRRTGAVSEVWVRWQSRPNLFFSGPEDRHYVVERTRGRLRFGDGRRGRIPPPGPDNLVARRYRSGGGQAGNVPAGAITELLSGVLAEAVTNPRPAEGGADAQPTDDILRTGPDAIRHRRQAVSAADYEALAREASPAVAVARALPATHPVRGAPAPGWVTVVLVPHSTDPQPVPGFGLLRQVERFLAARAPAPVGGRVLVVGPTYHPIGVNARVTPVDPEQAGPVRDAVVAAVRRFLHPLTGGPAGRGWEFGRDVYLSDLAVVVEGVPGVDHVSSLELLREGSPQGELVAVPLDRIVVAGPIWVTLAGAEE